MPIKVLKNTEVQGLCMCLRKRERERKRGNKATKISSVVLPSNMGRLFFLACS